MRTITLATCTLNQWAMDFEGNYKRILKTIIEAKQKGATYRCGPELEVTGYGCADHFFDNDTFLHSWEVIAEIMKDERCRDIIIDIGLPVMHKNISYNCRVIFLNSNIFLIRPKKKLCDNGIYRESRWFTGWVKDYCIEDFTLPKIIQDISGQITVPIGDAVIYTSDTSIGFEICEELWNPDSSLLKQCFTGVEITVNSSGGFHEIGRTKDVIDVIKSATHKCGGIYVFSNLRGCDGDRVYYHGTSHITINGEVSAIGEQFSLKDTEVVTATLDLDDVINYRQRMCWSTSEKAYPHIDIDYSITSYKPVTHQDSFIRTPIYEKGEEIGLGPACWLWDYLRKSNHNGILLSMTDDVDSCSSAVIIYSMCNLICKAIQDGNSSVLSDVRKIINDPKYMPLSPQELCSKILVTCHLDTNDDASNQTDTNLKDLALQIGSNHFNIPVENIIYTIINILCLACGKLFGREEKNRMTILQSNKERIKMIILYIFSEILSLNKSFPNRILVLGVGNADKALLGNFVKYGCFSGDISLTGGINQENLKNFLEYSEHYFKLTCLSKILFPEITENSNFESVGTPEDICVLSELKKNHHGPYSAFCKLASKYDSGQWPEIAKKVKCFFHLYSLHVSKIFSIAPCLHLGSYATVNSYYSQHQMLYNTEWTWQYFAIDRELISRNN